MPICAARCCVVVPWRLAPNLDCAKHARWKTHWQRFGTWIGRDQRKARESCTVWHTLVFDSRLVTVARWRTQLERVLVAAEADTNLHTWLAGGLFDRLGHFSLSTFSLQYGDVQWALRLCLPTMLCASHDTEVRLTEPQTACVVELANATRAILTWIEADPYHEGGSHHHRHLRAP